MTEEKTQTSAPEAEGTGNPTPEAEKPETGGQSAPTVDYEAKFKASQAEAMRLLDDKRRIESEHAQVRERVTGLEKQLKELEDVAKGANPEGYDGHKLRQYVEGLRADLSQMKERQELESFTAANPEAAKYRETLKDLGRAYPGRTYREIWESSLRTVAEAERASAESKAERRNAAPDSGRGTKTGEPASDNIGGYSLDAFNKLPLEKRKAILARQQYEKMPF